MTHGARYLAAISCLSPLLAFRCEAATTPGGRSGGLTGNSGFSLGQARKIQAAQKRLQNAQFRLGRNPMKGNKAKPRVVVLGTGWGAMGFLRSVDVTKYDVTVVSPRDVFVFTPFLPSVCAGTLSARAAVEPVRQALTRGGKPAMKFFEAHADDVDVDKRTVTCTSKSGDVFTLTYDDLVLCVGSESNTFGLPGVQANSIFLKEVEHAERIRGRYIDNFERAALPGVSEKERRRLLHFVCVGGGPTGIECAAEVSDFIQTEGRKHFPDLAPLAQVTLIEMLPKILPAFGEKASAHALRNFNTMGIQTLLKTKVTKISDDNMTLEGPDGTVSEMPYGVVVWASGIGQVPLNKKLLQKVPAQAGNRVLNVDEQLKLKGVPGVYALGDCAYVTPPKLQDSVDSLYETATDSITGAGAEWLRCQAAVLSRRFPQVLPALDTVLAQPEVPAGRMNKAAFRDLLKRIDSQYKPPAPTAQNASQMGKYLGSVFNSFMNAEARASNVPSFIPVFRGRMAYVGRHRGVADLPYLSSFTGGIPAGLLWKGVYWGMQLSWTNRVLMGVDWMKAALRGRDVARPHMQETQGWATGTPARRKAEA